MNHELIIKFGSQEHLQRLLDIGEVYMNTLKHFREKEHDAARGDAYEGLEKIKSMDGAKLYKNNESGESELIGTVNSGLARYKNSNLDKVNIYSLFYLKIREAKEIEIDKFINDQMKGGFGDSALIIYDPQQFLVMVKDMILKSGFEHWRRLVEYVDIKNLNNEVGPFRKDSSFSYQQELRIAAFHPDREYGPVIFNIGSLAHIACLVHMKDLSDIKLCY